MDGATCAVVVIRGGGGGLRGGGGEDGVCDEVFADGKGGRGVGWVFGYYFFAEEVVVQGVGGYCGHGFGEGWEIEFCADVVFDHVKSRLGVAKEEEYRLM